MQISLKYETQASIGLPHILLETYKSAFVGSDFWTQKTDS